MRRKKKTTRAKLISKLDKLFSEIIRSKGFCERCGKTSNLQCSHIYSRSNKRLRWDLENALCLCGGCHLFWWHKEPAEAVRWAMNIKDFDYLDKIKQQSAPIKIDFLEQTLLRLQNTRKFDSDSH